MSKIRLDKRVGKTVKNERDGVIRRKSVKSLKALYDSFYNAKKAEGRAIGTLNNYDAAFRLLWLFLEARNMDDNIDNLDAEDYRDFIVWLQEEYVKFDGHKYKPDDSKTVGLSARSIHGTIKVLKMFYGFLIDERLTDYNPLETIKNISFIDKEIDVLTVSEIKLLMNATDIRTYPGFRDNVLMTLLLDTMIRINEAVSLRLKDIDFATPSIHIRAEIAKNRRPRVVPMQKRTARLIKELTEEIAVFESEYVFLANYGEQLTTNHFRKQLNRYAERVGIKRTVHPHLFRHTGATMFLEAGGDIRHLQLILGHSDLRMVTRYTHLSGASIVNQHNQYSPINNVIGPLNKERKILR